MGWVYGTFRRKTIWRWLKLILTKVPLRITLAGGGTDLPSFYEKHGGFWVSAAIDKHIYVIVKDRFEPEPRISYSKLEIVEDTTKIEHPIIRECLKKFGVLKNIEILTFADLPGSSGLGSSGAFATALVVAMLERMNTNHRMRHVAAPEIAFEIEHDILGRTTGRQDHYASYFGGVRAYTSTKEGRIKHSMVREGFGLELYLAMYYTGITRAAEPILQQVSNKENAMLKIQDIGYETYNAIKRREYYKVGKLFDDHWKVKRSITPEMSTGLIDKWYNVAIKNGAEGGKLIGAGGGGFLLFYVDPTNRQKLKDVLSAEGLKETPFFFNRRGVEVFHI